MLTEKEKEILDVFAIVIPKLSEKQQDNLLWLGKGIEMKAEQQENTNDST